MKRFVRLLRSRRLAVWVIIAFIGYAAVATTVSGGDWERPYGSPVFLALATLVALSTAACAWERTRAALRVVRSGGASPSVVQRLRERPPITMSVRVGVDALDAAECALGPLGLRVTRNSEMLDARTGLLTVLGSPVFHWSLALLFVVVGTGQLTRAEGLMGVPSGSFRPDVAESYGRLEVGPLAGELSGRIIAVPEIAQKYTANGVEQGITPLVEIRSPEGGMLASGYAYANHPIRYRSMLVHANDDGLAAIVTVSADSTSLSSEVLLDYTQDRTSVVPDGFTVTDANELPVVTILFSLPEAVRDPGAAPSVRVRAAPGDASPADVAAVDVVAGTGDSVDIAEGVVLTVDRLTSYARLSVVDDWSVYYIYGLFLLAGIGLVLAVFAPFRGVRILLVEEPDGSRLHVAVRHGRGDPHFPARVESELAKVLGVEEAS